MDLTPIAAKQCLFYPLFQEGWRIFSFFLDVCYFKKNPNIHTAIYTTNANEVFFFCIFEIMSRSAVLSGWWNIICKMWDGKTKEN